MGTVFKSDLDTIAQVSLRDRVRALNPYWSGYYPGGVPGNYLAPFSYDPNQARPSLYGVSAGNKIPTAASIRADVITLGMYYNNIIRGTWGGGSAYFVCGDTLPTNSYRPDSNPYIVVGTDGTGYGMSNGGGTDDGLSGTNNSYGGYSQNSWSGSILQDYAITHRNVGGNRWFCLRYKPGGYAGKYCMLYDQNFNIIAYGQMFYRQDMGYALAGLSIGFDSYVGQLIYIYISDGPPPTPTDTVKMTNHKAAYAAAMNAGVGTISGDITQAKVAALYTQAWNVFNVMKDADVINFN